MIETLYIPTMGRTDIQITYDNLPYKYQKMVKFVIPKKEFKLMLRNEIGTQNDILIDELNQLGISLEKGSVYFDYSTAIKDGGLMTFRPKSQARGSCAFSLGCTSHFDQLSIDNEHPLPRSRGSNLEGSQDMCTWHNQMKRDSMLFDHHSIHDLIFDTKRA